MPPKSRRIFKSNKTILRKLKSKERFFFCYQLTQKPNRLVGLSKSSIFKNFTLESPREAELKQNREFSNKFKFNMHCRVKEYEREN